MRFFTLLFLLPLTAIILTGCERQLISPVDPIDPPETDTQFAQMALLSLANTATKVALVDLANAASEVAEALAIDDGTSVQPTFSRLARLADVVTGLERGFVNSGCEIELRNFAEASVNVVKAYTIRDAADMEKALQNLAQEALNADPILAQFPTENIYIPFAFTSFRGNSPLYVLGVILVQYDDTIRPALETRAAVVEFLTLKGYKVQVAGVISGVEAIYLDAPVDPLLLLGELIKIPGVALVQPNFLYEYQLAVPPPPSVEIMWRVTARYNEAWCQGNFDAIDGILIEESGLDFFDYAFVGNLATIYAEEIPETAAHIQTNTPRYPLWAIAVNFLDIYFQNSKKTLDEVVELFRQYVRTGQVRIPYYY